MLELVVPLVSVIIPCFNQGRFLGETLRSLQRQTHPDWEALVIDDGSTDDSAVVAGQFVAADVRVRLLSQENRGLSASRNRGIDEARGEYLQFLDADDVILPDKLERQVAAMAACARPALSYCDFTFGCEDDVHTPMPMGNYGQPRLSISRPLEDMAERWESGLTIAANCFLFDASLFRAPGVRFDARLANHEDWDCWMTILALRPAIVHVPERLAIYRWNAHSISRKTRSMRDGFLKALSLQLERHRGNAPLRELLTVKRRDVRLHYGALLRYQRRRWWRERIPWRLQQAVYACLHVSSIP